MGGADLAIVPKIDDVTKVPEEGRLDPEKLIADVRANGAEAWYLESVEDIVDHVAERAQSGDVVATLNQAVGAVLPYNGINNVPAFDAAFSVAADMGSEPALAAVGLTAQDARVWTPVGN